MAATSLIRLFVILLILIALVLSSGLTWGSPAALDEDAPSIVHSVETPSWFIFDNPADSQ